IYLCFFFFQAEDGIRYWSVTGVQTCALPISLVPDVHVIGDACLGGGIPKSASAASAQGNACAAAIVTMMAGKAPETPRLAGICRSEERRVGEECRCGWSRGP